MLLQPGDGGDMALTGCSGPRLGSSPTPTAAVPGWGEKAKQMIHRCQDCRGREQVVREACKTSPDSQSLEQT